MIKDIVVKLSVGERASPAEDYALSVAATFAAHITGIGFRYYPIVQVAGAPYTVADEVYGSSFAAGNIPPELIEMQRRDNAAALGLIQVAMIQAAVDPQRASTCLAAATFDGFGRSALHRMGL